MAKTPRTWTGARTPSGLKRVRQAERRREVLQPRRSAAKTHVAKALRAAASPADSTVDPTVALVEALSALDRAAKAGAIHPNAAARRKSRLTRKVNAALGGAQVQTGGVTKSTGRAAAQKAAKARIAAGKADKAKGAQTAAGKARAALSKTARAEAAAAKAAEAADVTVAPGREGRAEGGHQGGPEDRGQEGPVEGDRREDHGRQDGAEGDRQGRSEDQEGRRGQVAARSPSNDDAPVIDRGVPIRGGRRRASTAALFEAPPAIVLEGGPLLGRQGDDVRGLVESAVELEPAARRGDLLVDRGEDPGVDPVLEVGGLRVCLAPSSWYVTLTGPVSAPHVSLIPVGANDPFEIAAHSSRVSS